MRDRVQDRQTLTASRSGQGPRRSTQEKVGCEDILIRNYDHRWGYDLCLEVLDDDSDVVFEDRYYLHPGRVESEIDVLPAGSYRIHAKMDNLHEAEFNCPISADPENTLVVEIGNGALSLTEGLTE